MKLTTFFPTKMSPKNFMPNTNQRKFLEGMVSVLFSISNYFWTSLTPNFRGVSSTVRRCVEKETGREYACKIMDISGDPSENDGPQLRESTLREISILRRVAGHPFISITLWKIVKMCIVHIWFIGFSRASWCVWIRNIYLSCFWALSEWRTVWLPHQCCHSIREKDKVNHDFPPIFPIYHHTFVQVHNEATLWGTAACPQNEHCSSWY